MYIRKGTKLPLILSSLMHLCFAAALAQKIQTIHRRQPRPLSPARDMVKKDSWMSGGFVRKADDGSVSNLDRQSRRSHHCAAV